MADFDPATLFASSEEGVIYDVQVLGSMWQDSAGTTPAVVDSPVGRIDDLSGNGNHCVQATAGFRPILRHDYSGYYLEGDGVDDRLRVTFTIAQPWTRISYIDRPTWAGAIFGGGGNHAGDLYNSVASPRLRLYSGVQSAQDTGSRFPLTAQGLITEVHNGASSAFAVNQDAVTTTDAGTTAPNGITLFANALNGNFSDTHIYGVVMINRLLTATEHEDVHSWLTARFVRVLVVDGDSNSYMALPTANGYAYQYTPNASPVVFLQNIAYGGTGLDSNVSPPDLVYRTAEIDQRLPVDKRGRQYVYFPWWTNNSVGDTAADIAAFLQARKAAGWDKVGIGTWCERSDSGQENAAFRAAFNTTVSTPGWIAANGIDFLVDFAADPVIGAVGASTDTDLVSDLVHFTSLGHTYLEAVFRAALNGLPLSDPPSQVGNLTNLFYAAEGGFHGYGSQLLVGNGASPETFEAIAEVSSIAFGAMTTAVFTRTHLRSPAAHQEKRAGLRDSGPFQLTGNWRPTHESQSNAGGGTGSFISGGLIALWRNRSEKNFILRLSDGSPGTALPFRGVVSKFQPGTVGPDGKVDFSAEITPLRDFSSSLP